MTIYDNGAIVGMSDAVHNDAYRQNLETKSKEILGKENVISLDNLKNNSVFSKYYNELDDKGKSRIEQIAKMVGDPQSVTNHELKVILAVMDANLQKYSDNYRVTEKFYMDNEPSTGNMGGLNQATDDEIKSVYYGLLTEEDNAVNKQDQQNYELKLVKNFGSQVKPYTDAGRVNGGDWARTMQYLTDIDNVSMNEVREQAFNIILNKGKIVHTSMSRDGSSEWKLSDGTTVYWDNGFNPTEKGYVTVKHADGVVEKFKPDGSKVE